MSKQIIRPEGAELTRYLNEGYAICNRCGAVMDMDGKNYIYICPGCGWAMDEADYEYDYGEDPEWAPGILAAYEGDVPPEGCLACGGPYPDCKTSCPIFDA